MLFPNDPAAGPALDAYATELWRLHQRDEVPAYCANRDELFALVALVSALRQRSEEHQRLKATDKRTLDEMGIGRAI